MLRCKPKLTYNGLTVVLSNPSRFDNTSLLTSTGGRLFNDLLRPEFNVAQCDIRVKEDRTDLLQGTKCIMLLGQDSASSWLQNTDNTIGEIRGSVYKIQDIATIPSFFPQDAADIKDYESEHNSSNHEVAAEVEREEEEDSASEKRRHGRTRRKNYAFWLKKDLEKVKYLITHNGIIPSRPFEPNYEIYPPADFVIKRLRETKNQNLFIDIETDSNLNLLCFAFSFGRDVWTVPCLSHDYSWAYSNLHQILQALAIAFRDNTVIAHNGANFDFFVFAYKYHISIGKKVKDTMLMHHRCYPEVEKSLGHCTSIWTWEPFHKDEGGGGYNNTEQCKRMWSYCGKDVYTMVLIHDSILQHAKRIPGLLDSIEQVSESIRPYLITTLTGIKYDQEKLLAIVKENDRLMTQYLRIIHLLVGETTVKKLKTRFKSSLPSSNPQCVEYFHNMLGYPIVGRGKVKKDGTRGASLAKKNIFKLRLKFNNPVLDLVIAYRELAKESGTLKFLPWKTDEPKTN